MGAKAYDPETFAGAGVVEVIALAVVAGLACLGVPLEHPQVVVHAVPLGGLLAIGAALFAGAATRAGSVRESVWFAAQVGVLFALFCGAVSIFTGLAEGPHDISVRPAASAALGALWGFTFALAGALSGPSAIGPRLRRIVGRGPHGELPSSRPGRLMAGILMGAVASGIVLFLGAVVVLALATVGLAMPPSADAGEVGASAVAVAAFAPNLAGAVVDVSVGASLDVAAEVVVDGERIAGNRIVALLGPRASRLPPAALLLAIVPAVACTVGGRACARYPGSDLAAVPIGAVTFSASLFVLARFGGGELGAGSGDATASFRVAADAVEVGAFALAWGLAFGCIGWVLTRRSDRASTTASDPGRG